MSEKLKPCPFCGWKRVSITGRREYHSYLWDKGVYKCIVSAKCNKCHARGGSVSGFIPNYISKCLLPNEKITSYKELEAEAVKAWNRRANDGKTD